MLNDWDFKFWLLFSILTLLISGFWGGVVYERRDWQSKLPDAMEQLCKECSGITE